MMQPDSTQSDFKPPVKKRKKRRNSSPEDDNKKPSTSKRKKKKSHLDFHNIKILSCPEMNASQELKPISFYIDDPVEMVSQMFESVKGDLQDILPNELKDCTLCELKNSCVQHLQKMTKKNILLILSGEKPEYMENILSKDDSNQIADSTCNDQQLEGSFSKDDCAEEKVQEPSADTLALSPNQKEVSCLYQDPVGNAADESASGTLEQGQKALVENVRLICGKEWEQSFTKTQMEILELELRARAIKALMKAQENRSGTPADELS